MGGKVREEEAHRARAIEKWQSPIWAIPDEVRDRWLAHIRLNGKGMLDQVNGCGRDVGTSHPELHDAVVASADNAIDQAQAYHRRETRA